MYTDVINSPLKHTRETSDGTMHHGNRAAGGQVVFFMTNRLNNPSYGTHHDPERAYLTEQRIQVDSVDRPFDCGFVDVKVPAVSCPVVTCDQERTSRACMGVLSPEPQGIRQR